MKHICFVIALMVFAFSFSGKLLWALQSNLVSVVAVRWCTRQEKDSGILAAEESRELLENPSAVPQRARFNLFRCQGRLDRAAEIAAQELKGRTASLRPYEKLRMAEVSLQAQQPVVASEFYSLLRMDAQQLPMIMYKVKPDAARAAIQAGLQAREKGDLSEARRWFWHALSWAPDDLIAKYNLERLSVPQKFKNYTVANSSKDSRDLVDAACWLYRHGALSLDSTARVLDFATFTSKKEEWPSLRSSLLSCNQASGNVFDALLGQFCIFRQDYEGECSSFVRTYELSSLSGLFAGALRVRGDWTYGRELRSQLLALEDSLLAEPQRLWRWHSLRVLGASKEIEAELMQKLKESRPQISHYAIEGNWRLAGLSFVENPSEGWSTQPLHLIVYWDWLGVSDPTHLGTYRVDAASGSDNSAVSWYEVSHRLIVFSEVYNLAPNPGFEVDRPQSGAPGGYSASPESRVDCVILQPSVNGAGQVVVLNHAPHPWNPYRCDMILASPVELTPGYYLLGGWFRSLNSYGVLATDSGWAIGGVAGLGWTFAGKPMKVHQQGSIGIRVSAWGPPDGGLEVGTLLLVQIVAPELR